MALLAAAWPAYWFIDEYLNGQDHELPSSFTEEFHRDPARVAQYRANVLQAVADGRPLHALYDGRTNAPLIVETLALKAHEVMADVGCGLGGLELSLLERGIEFSRIYALDIDADALDFLRFQLDAAPLDRPERIVPLLTRKDDTTLDENSVDVVLILNAPVYSRVPPAELVEYGYAADDLDANPCMESVWRALRPGGRLVVFDDVEGIPIKGVKCKPVLDLVPQHGFEIVRHDEVQLYDVPGEPTHCRAQFVTTKQPDPVPAAGH
ncbi:MAG: class I SAM-dependent methyltransferase [Myxococcota bacterium]|nr:class I SAM-dependent methyltransferase [Myxococcota bacterium]